MAIDVIANRYHGKVILMDEKSDGSVVILVCEEWDPTTPPAAPALTPTRGPVAPSEPEPEPEQEPEIYPEGGLQSLGTLTLNASAMPSGLSAFIAERFSSACIELLQQGIHTHTLTSDSERFGFSARLDDGMPAGGIA